MTAITVVRHTGQSCLVEWTDSMAALRRAVVPVYSVVDNEVAAEELEHGVPYGIEWEQVLDLRVTPEKVAQELRKRGIWTAQDLRTQLPQAVAAFQAAYAADATSLLVAVERIEKTVKGVT